jgi:hypothetical protein
MLRFSSLSLPAVCISICLISCGLQGDCLQEESLIVTTASHSSGEEKIELSNFFKFDWDELYVVVGPRFPEDVTNMIGVSYPGTIPDDTRQYIFLKAGQIVRDQSSTCQDLDFSYVTKQYAFIKYLYKSKVPVLCRRIGDGNVCVVQDEVRE